MSASPNPTHRSSSHEHKEDDDGDHKEHQSIPSNNALNAVNGSNGKVAKSSIVIGATYSHSDNEMIDEKLKSMKRRQKAKKRNFTKKTRGSNLKDPNLKSKGTSKGTSNGDPQSQNQGDDEKDIPSSSNQDVSTLMTSQFLKNVDMTQIKSSVNSLLSNSSQSINNFMQKQRDKVSSMSMRNGQSGGALNGKSSNFLKAIPQKCLELWKRSQEYEVNRFAKMSAQATYRPFHSKEKADYFDNSESISWEGLYSPIYTQ